MKVVIAGGGTGGHLFPGIALAEELKARGHDVLFVGTQSGIEARVCPRDGWPLELITVSGIKGKGVFGALGGIAAVPRAVWQSRGILRRFGADAVVGVGGYASGPVGLAALGIGTPLYLLEQNSVPGITNRVLGRGARRVFGTFEGARRFFPSERFVLSGNPLRRAVRDALTADTTRARATRLLIVGGSQGARGVNNLVRDALIALHRRGVVLPVTHQCGNADLEALRAEYAEAGVAIDLQPFIEKMADAYATAKLVIGRAGATTISELLALGLPSLLIPLPTAADDHQTKNAEEIAALGAAIVCPQKTTTADALAQQLEALFNDPATLATMSQAALGAAKRDAHAAIADAIANSSNQNV